MKRKVANHKELKHPLILEFPESHSEVFSSSVPLVPDRTEKELLANQLPFTRSDDMGWLTDKTGMAKMIVGVVLVT
jgi:hypothetical protein